MIDMLSLEVPLKFSKLFASIYALTGVHFGGELRHVGHVGDQKIKYGPIRNWEIMISN